MNTAFSVIKMLLVLFFLVFNIIYHPPRYVVADEEPVPMEVEDKNEGKILVNGFYTWEQDSWNIFQLFHFFPSKRQLCLYNKEYDEKTKLNKEIQSKLSATVSIPFNIPIWKYWLATISVLIIVILFIILSKIESLITYSAKYKSAKKINSFKSYKDFLLLAKPPGNLRKKAEKNLKDKIGVYKKFIDLVTLKTSGELKDVVLKIIESIEQTGNVQVKVDFQEDIQVTEQQDFIKKNINKIERFINTDIGELEFSEWKNSMITEADLYWSEQEMDLLLNNSSDLKKIKEMLVSKKDMLLSNTEYQFSELAPFLSEEHTKVRQRIFIKLLNNLFKNVFTEKIINIKRKCDSLITFHIKSKFRNKETFGSWPEDSEIPINERPMMPDIQCSWEFYVSIKGSESSEKDFVSDTISTTTTYPLYRGEKNNSKLFLFRFTSAFAKFCEDIAGALGMLSDVSESKEIASIPQTEVYSHFENKFHSYFIDKTAEIPTSLTEEFYGDYTSSLEDLLVGKEQTEELIAGIHDVISGDIGIGDGLEIVGDILSDIITN